MLLMLLFSSYFHLHPPATALGDFATVNQAEGSPRHLPLYSHCFTHPPDSSSSLDPLGQTDKFSPLDKIAFLGRHQQPRVSPFLGVC